MKRFVGLLAACAAAPVAPPERPIIYAPSVVVRLADRQDVFPKPTLVADPASGGCPTARGHLAPELYQPILTYVRTHIVRDGHPHAQMISDDDAPTLPQGVSILIEPRTEIGQLAIETHDGTFASGHSFCMHVRHDGNRTLIILEPAGDSIT